MLTEQTVKHNYLSKCLLLHSCQLFLKV